MEINYVNGKNNTNGEDLKHIGIKKMITNMFNLNILNYCSIRPLGYNLFILVIIL